LKHARVSHAWRPHGARIHRRRLPGGALIALAFNICLFLLPVGGAAALLVITRDHLYAYEYSEAGARSIITRVERLNGDLIQLDFDRLRQWDDLVALELMAGDIPAARGFLLSGAGMLQGRTANLLKRADNDAEREAAALELLSPGTRARYESIVPLLSRRSASGAEQRTTTQQVTLGDPQDFELMARALLTEPETDTLQFALTGFGLGLAGDAEARLVNGAAALLLASRRPDYPTGLQADVAETMNAAMSLEEFRTGALAAAEGDAAGNYANAAAAFRAAVDPAAAAEARALLMQVGAMADAISVSAAADLLLHAASARDIPRLRLLAQTAGDRAAAAAKRLPRDGRLIEAAGGELTINRDLAIALTVTVLALLGILAMVFFKLYQAARPLWRGAYADDEGEEEYGGELVDLGGVGASNWRPL
jgi:hypothetical protein